MLKGKKEYLEAEHAERTFKLLKHLDGLSQDEKDNHAQITSICTILNGRKIPFFFFPFMRSWGNPKEFGFWQFNNIINLFGYDEKETPSKESKEKYDLFVKTVFAYILSMDGPVNTANEAKEKLCEIYDRIAGI